MTSLNTTTGWDANKQTGSNLTHSNIQERSEAGIGRDGSSSHNSTNATPSSSSSSSSSTPSPGGAEITTTDPELDIMHQRELFYQKYDYRTGVRIASTLGGFFLIVLLTLLYKSKCKHKHSREPSTLSLHNMPYPAVHPQHLMIGQNIQVNGRHDFGGSGGGGGGGSNGSPGLPMSLTLLDSPCYGYMNQVHPANRHQPIFSNCYSTDGQVKSPAVLLTSANSESSDEDLSLISEHRGAVGGPEVPPERKRMRNPLGPIPPYRQVLRTDPGESTSHYHLHPRSKSPPTGSRIGGNKGNIDINVILPTPSISPSGSENFNTAAGQCFDGNQATMVLLPRGAAVGRGERRLVVARSLSSDNENDNSEMSGGGSDSEAPMLPFGCGNSSLFSLDNLKYVDDTSSENIPTRASDADDQDQDQDTRSIGSDSVFACFEHNFDHIAPTYARRVSSVSGTSSGVLVTHVPPTPPAAQPQSHTSELMKVSGGGCGGGSSGFGEGDETEFRVTLTQAHAQVHHRDSLCSDLESVNDYMETGARRRSSSTQTTLSDLRQSLGYSPTGWSGFGGGEACSGGGTSPGTTSLASYPHHETPPKLSVPRRKRSLSPHHTMSNATTNTSGHLLSPSTPVVSSSNTNSTSAFLSVSLHPPPLAAGGSAEALTPTTPTNPPSMMMLSPSTALSQTSPLISPSRIMRKRSFDNVKKTLSLQYEEKTEGSGFFVSSSNETTPTN